jgi:hypothetical protein
LTGGTASDRLFGDAGADILDGGAAEDVLIGGPDEGDICILPDGARMSCEPEIAVDPAGGRVGDGVRVTGVGWYPESGDANFYFELDGASSNEPAWTIAIEPEGDFEEEQSIPEVRSGAYDIRACQVCSLEGEFAPPFAFTIEADTTTTTAPPPIEDITIQADPLSMRAPGTITVSGDGWTRDGVVWIFFDPLDITEEEPSVRTPVSPTGHFQTELVLQQNDPGSYRVVACQRCRTPRVVERATIVTIEAAGALVWLWGIPVVLALLFTGAWLGSRVRSNAGRKESLGNGGDYRGSLSKPRIELSTSPAGSDHSVVLIPRADTGMQELEEVDRT